MAVVYFFRLTVTESNSYVMLLFLFAFASIAAQFWITCSCKLYYCKDAHY